MDEELRRYLETMESRIMARISDTTERLIERMNGLERDFQNTKGFLIEDSLVLGRRWSDLERRVTKLERDGDGSAA
jgi:hypothetical protein